MAHDSIDAVKKTLVDSGHLVYRIVDDVVYLAELVRDNLIMDANVSVRAGQPMTVRVAVRAQRSDFPSSSDTELRLFQRARDLGSPLIRDGFLEVRQEIIPLPDPMDPDVVLDTWFEITFEKAAPDEAELQAALRIALGVEKVAPR